MYRCIDAKEIEKKKNLYHAFVDLEKTLDMVIWWAMCKTGLRVFLNSVPLSLP